MNEWVKIALGRVVVDMGQFSAADKRALDKAVRAGVLRKWRGFWYPVAGASWGIGTPRSCYAAADVAPDAHMRVSLP